HVPSNPVPIVSHTCTYSVLSQCILANYAHSALLSTFHRRTYSLRYVSSLFLSIRPVIPSHEVVWVTPFILEHLTTRRTSNKLYIRRLLLAPIFVKIATFLGEGDIPYINLLIGHLHKLNSVITQHYFILQNPSIVLVHYLNVPSITQDDKLCLPLPTFFEEDRSELSRNSVLEQLLPMFSGFPNYISRPQSNRQLHFDVSSKSQGLSSHAHPVIVPAASLLVIA
ncbi:uncharacterized protein DEA37_0013004, partial [Paragonimus westermani]